MIAWIALGFVLGVGVSIGVPLLLFYMHIRNPNARILWG